MAGLAGIQSACVIFFGQTAAGAVSNDYTLTRPGFVLDAWNHAQANQVGGTVQVLRQVLGSGAFNAVTDAMNAGVATAVTHAGVLPTTFSWSATDVLRFTTVGASTQVNVSVLYTPFPLADQTTIP